MLDPDTDLEPIKVKNAQLPVVILLGLDWTQA